MPKFRKKHQEMTVYLKMAQMKCNIVVHNRRTLRKYGIIVMGKDFNQTGTTN